MPKENAFLLIRGQASFSILLNDEGAKLQKQYTLSDLTVSAYWCHTK